MDSLSALADFDCTKTKFEYDIAGRLVKRIWPDGAPVTYSYNDRAGIGVTLPLLTKDAVDLSFLLAASC